VDAQRMQARIDELMDEFNRLRAGADDLQRKLKEVSATVRSRDGFVTATVGPRGQLTKLELDPRIYRKPDSRELAETIVDTVRRATEDALGQVEELCKPLLPAEEVRAHMDYDFDGMFRRMDSELAELEEGESR
jgi:DNA-binding protein YbaB